MIKKFCSAFGTYKWMFNTETGQFIRWGITMQDDPQWSPVGPEILDIEVSTICHRECKFCYKGNTGKGKNMSFLTFKTILDKMPENLMQVAFGIGDLSSNPELFMMFDYCRSKNIVPNVTINGYELTLDRAKKLAAVCGAVSISNYDRNFCETAIHRLNYYGLKQINIHQLLCEETFGDCLDLVERSRTNPILQKLNAIVFLALKQKGRGTCYTPISDVHFNDLVSIVLERGIKFGFDSCTACKFMEFVRKNPKYKYLLTSVEPCESGLFSSYINVDGLFFPCSFLEGRKEGLNVVNCNNFINDIWYHPRVMKWRDILLQNKRACPVYKI